MEAKDEIHRNRSEAEREIKERRNETQKLERRLAQKEETLDRKTDALNQKSEELNRRLTQVQKTQESCEQLKNEQLAALERISGLTREEAKDYLVSSIEQEAQHDAAVKLREINQRMKRRQSPPRVNSSPSPFSAVPPTMSQRQRFRLSHCPTSEMKGRIIGREGRNIPAR